MSAAKSETIGFIGTGNVGFHMVVNLLADGHEVVAYDTRPEPLEELAEKGAKVASSSAEVGERCGIVHVLVASDAQVMDVIEGSGGGLASTLAPGSIVLLHSTLGPETVQRAAEILEGRSCHVLDAPVSGTKGAEASAMHRCMTFMLGGPDEIVERVSEDDDLMLPFFYKVPA